MSSSPRLPSSTAMSACPIALVSASKSTSGGGGAASRILDAWREPARKSEEKEKRKSMNDAGSPDEHYRFIGKPMPRKEDARLITGKGRFTDDFNLDGQAFAVMVRSPYPHARIVAIDTARAAAMPGVLGVFTGADCAADGLSPIPHDPVPKTRYDMKLHGPGGSAVFIGPQPLLPADKVRHVGEAVAMVVAETKAQALDAAEAGEGRYQEL